MVYIQQAMNSLLEHHKSRPPHYPRIHVIPIWEDSLDNLPEPESSSSNRYPGVFIGLTILI